MAGLRTINLKTGEDSAVNGGVGVISKTIDSSSTDSECASSKAVYEYVNDKLGDIENLLSQI